MNNCTIVCLDGDTLGNDMDWTRFEQLGTLKVYPSTNPDEISSRIKGANIVITNLLELDAAAIASAPHLKLICCAATGFNIVDTVAARKHDISVCNVKNYSTASVMQHTFALLLNIAGGIVERVEAVAQGKWVDSLTYSSWTYPMVEIEGKTLGIVGYGAIGATLAKVAHAFGMNILAYNHRPKQLPEFRPFEFTDLNDLLRRSDFVSLHTPLTQETEKMINQETLQLMKPSAFLINCSRGGLIDEHALRMALDQKTIAGAALDVTAVEPMPQSSPLVNAPNCLITPHIAWASLETRDRLVQGVFDNIHNFLAGTPSNIVN